VQILPQLEMKRNSLEICAMLELVTSPLHLRMWGFPFHRRKLTRVQRLLRSICVAASLSGGLSSGRPNPTTRLRPKPSLSLRFLKSFLYLIPSTLVIFPAFL